MRSITITVSETVPANIETVYSVIADYQIRHQAILPRPAFQEMKVLEGGFGSGTCLHVHVRIWGQSYFYEQIVEEPIMGRILIEREINTGQTTTFTLQALAGNQTQVTITSVNPLSTGFRGYLERISQPSIIGNLFKKELQNLIEYVAQNEFAIQGA